MVATPLQLPFPAFNASIAYRLKSSPKANTSMASEERKVASTAPDFEIARLLNSSSPGTREGPSKMVACKVETDDEVYQAIDNIHERCPNMGGISIPSTTP